VIDDYSNFVEELSDASELTTSDAVTPSEDMDYQGWTRSDNYTPLLCGDFNYGATCGDVSWTRTGYTVMLKGKYDASEYHAEKLALK